MRDAGILRNTAVAVSDGRIAMIGAARDLEHAYSDAEVIDCHGCVLTPGLVDSHTHAVFGKPRLEDQELRADGFDYMEIGRRGGGIHSSVRDFREQSEADLYNLAVTRVKELAAYGTTTLEIKSGYGLSVEDELKALRVIGRLAERQPMRIVATWLGAHEIPQEYRTSDERRVEFIDLLVNEIWDDADLLSDACLWHVQAPEEQVSSAGPAPDDRAERLARAHRPYGSEEEAAAVDGSTHRRAEHPYRPR